MIAEKKLESLEHSSARLTVTVDKEHARKEYDSLLEKYSKTAQIRGFRKGKVPPKILEQKYGESIRSETGMQLIESSLEEALKDIEKTPLQFEPPALQDEIDVKLGEDFTFTVTFDVFPDIELATYTSVEVEKPTVSITAEDVNRELERIQDQNAIIIDKADDATVEADDIVTIDYVEIDESENAVEGTERQDFTFTIGTGYNRYKIDDDLIGVKKDEEIIIEKRFEENFEDEELAGKTVRLKTTVTALKQKDLPDLDDDLAQDVSEEYKTLDDLKKHIKQQLKDVAGDRVRSRTVDAIMQTVRDGSTIDLPDSMVRAELENSWRSFLNRSGVDEQRMLSHLESQDQKKDDIVAEWRPDAERSLKSQLIMNEIVRREEISATDEDIEKEIAEQAERRNTDVETAREEINKSGMMEYLYSQIVNRKLFDFLIEKATMKTGEKIELVDLLQDNQ